MATNKRIYALIGAFICSITFMGATGCDEQDKILSDKYPMLTSGAQTTTTAKTTTAPKATTTKATTQNNDGHIFGNDRKRLHRCSV